MFLWLGYNQLSRLLWKTQWGNYFIVKTVSLTTRLLRNIKPYFTIQATKINLREMHYPFFLHRSKNKAGEEKVAEQHFCWRTITGSRWELSTDSQKGGAQELDENLLLLQLLETRITALPFADIPTKPTPCISLNCKNSSNCHLSKRKNELTMAYAHP